MASSSFAVPAYLALTDSHGKYTPTNISTSTYSIVTQAVSGLRWFDPYRVDLSALTLLSTPPLSSQLSSTSALLFVIGTNSIRSNSASVALSDIKRVIDFVRTTHPHLSSKHSINIICCFPCLKPIYPSNITHSLLNNIHEYNCSLFALVDTLNFTVLNFDVTPSHLGSDRMHLHHNYKDLVPDSINNYFAYLSSIPATVPFKTTDRSSEAVARPNHRRHIKRTTQQQQHVLKRRVSSPWRLDTIKTFLQEQHIKFAKLPPIYRNIIRIQFNNAPGYYGTVGSGWLGSLSDHFLAAGFRPEVQT
ncbi:unnamed protein product [Adineta ricciae]|uniref:SGNH hydrolase-type esterase domain-containing protein n=1 Tax=Adineta ricciae TaxID=249248 RepID=A0A815K7C4_ADIRI|nr:unnamed protein product [Adineta ricciae]CAF1643524.1 unnamed protein product [Adineta ricciae]